MKINKNINENIEIFERLFSDCGDIVKRKMPVGENEEFLTYFSYIDGLADRKYIEEQVISNMVTWLRSNPPNIKSHVGGIITAIKNFAVASADVEEIEDIEKLADGMMAGDCMILIDGADSALMLSSKGWANRGITQAETEPVLQGSKEAFTETFRMNTALIRRRIRDTNLKIYQTKAGKRSKTDIALCYIKGIARDEVLQEALGKIQSIDIDAIFDSGYIEQYLEDSTYTPFPQVQMTERPDKAAAAIMEGRIAIVVDNSPFVILIPATFNVFFQASEDYYNRFQISSFLRALRYVSSFFALGLSGLYIALTVFNTSMLPQQLTLKMAEARKDIAFPAVVEIVIMELAFELLREAGLRLPGSIGSTLGIVGGLIVGQAAVEAGIVSPIVVIVVALGGIASFAIPQQSLVHSFRLVKFYILALSSTLGLFGFWLAVLSVLTHLTSLSSFGVPYMYPLGSSDLQERGTMKDGILKAPLKDMTERPIFARASQRHRMTKRGE